MILKKFVINIEKMPFTVVKFNYNGLRNSEINTPAIKIEIKCDGKEIIYYNRKRVEYCKDYLKLDIDLKTRNYFYILSSGEDNFSFWINNEENSTSSIKSKITEKQLENLLYALSYKEYYKGKSDRALAILSDSLKDKYFCKTIINAFTVKERESCEENLLRAALNRKVKVGPKSWIKSRMRDGALAEGEILKDGTSFMQLLEIFEENKDKFIPVLDSRYKRIGKKVIDNYNAFKPDKAKRLTADFSDLVFSKEKLNISVRYEVQGNVTINPRQAKAVGFKHNVFRAKIYREQTIIRDGDINIDKFGLLASEKTIKYLQELEVKGLLAVLEKNDREFPGYTLIELDITKVPILNREYVLRNNSLDYILDNVWQQRLAECRQKVLRYYIEKSDKELCDKNLSYTKEQIELLKTYSLDMKGIYHGIDNKVDDNGENEYECRFFEFALKGFSSLPKVEDVIIKMKESGKRLNKPETIMADFIRELMVKRITMNNNVLGKLLEEQKSIIKAITRKLALIKLEKALTGSWWTGLKLDNRQNYIYESETNTLVVKVVKKTIRK